MDTFGNFIVYLGTPAALAFIVSYLLEPWAVFQALDAGRKRVVVLLLAGGLPVGSYLLVILLPAEVVTKLQPLYSLLFAMGVGLSGSQWFHKYFNVVPPPSTIITAQPIDETNKASKG